jgi:hypothetical protein
VAGVDAGGRDRGGGVGAGLMGNTAKKFFSKNNGYVYLIRSSDGSFKIGHSRVSAQNRLNSLQCANPHQLQLAISFPTVNSADAEHFLHSRFRHKRISGEWFRLDKKDLTEFFYFAEILERQFFEVRSSLMQGQNL